jgi:hypothetical protein
MVYLSSIYLVVDTSFGHRASQIKAGVPYEIGTCEEDPYEPADCDEDPALVADWLSWLRADRWGDPWGRKGCAVRG